MAEAADRTSVALAYARDVFARARVPMEPVDHEVNWDDQPSRHTIYPGAVRVALPEGMPLGLARLADALEEGQRRGALDLDGVATLLRCYGVVQRRLRINWNGDDVTRLHYPHTTWARPTASGGGMYPVELYWVAGPSGPLVPGVYHYATGHHELERLATGDVSEDVRVAVGDAPAAADTDQFLLLSLRYWKNAFKYSSFCYHVVTQDLGALLGSWQLATRGLDVPFSPVLWLDDARLDALLGFDPARESVHAVVPLPFSGDARDGGRLPPPATRAPARPVVRLAPWERSAVVLREERTEQVHASTVVGRAPRPGGDAIAAPAITEPAAGGDAVALPPPAQEALDRDLVAVLRSRRTSFGALTSNPRTEPGELGTALAVGASVRTMRCDVKDPDRPAPWTRLAVLANHVEGLAPGAYDYDSEGHRLLPVRLEDMTGLLQRSYFLTNYNLEQVAAFVAVIGRPDAMVAAFGDRGYRMLNHEVGAVAQATYCGAAAAGIGCGAVLGVDNLTINEILGLDEGDERTLLFLLLGRERDGEADLASPLLEPGRPRV